MSMSSLGQQLAAIQQHTGSGGGAGGGVGSSLATSKRHEDAVGRGVAHSVQLGYALKGSSSSSAKYKASILYEDSKQAADVPSSTIKENAVASLRFLQTEHFDQSCGMYVSTLCGSSSTSDNGNGNGNSNHGIMFERGLQTTKENESLDKQIEDLLFRLSLYLSSSSSMTSSCLHIIEFLIRQYDLHLRPRIASSALLALLPHHEEPYYLRLLQLIDLANLPEWTFLRPFAAPNSRLGRNVIAQQASKNNAFVRMLGQLSQRTVSLLKKGCGNSGHDGSTASSGSSSHCLSFTAAVLVEALTLQMKRTGSMDESTCNVLLPFVVTACKNNSGGGNRKSTNSSIVVEEWTSWGHVMASAIIETASLAAKPSKVLITNIIQGLMSSAIGTTGIGTSQSTLYNGLIVVLTILSAQDEDNGSGDDTTDRSYLPMLTGSVTGTGSSSGSSSIEYYCGFSGLDSDVLKSMIQLDSGSVNGQGIVNTRSSRLATCLGQLVGKDGLIDFINMIASILVVSWRRYSKNARKDSTNDDNMDVDDDELTKRSKKAKRKHEKNQALLQNLILGLITEPMLQEALWRANDCQWVSSMTSFVVLNTQLDQIVDAEEEKGSTDQVFLKSTLEDLKSIDRRAYEVGLAHGLIQIRKAKKRKQWAHWLGLSTSDDEDKEGSVHSDGGVASQTTLPPRVALEYADAAIRLDAISRLLKEASEEMNSSDEMGETIPQSLLRRFTLDDNEEVSLAAVKGLLSLLAEQNVSDSIVGAPLGRGVLSGIFFWAENSDSTLKRKSEIVEYGLNLVAFAASQIDRDEELLDFTILLEGLGSFMLSSEERVSTAAARGVVSAMSNGEQLHVSPSKLFDKACSMLVTDEDIIQTYQREFERKNRQEQYFRRKVVKLILDSFNGTLNVASKKLKQETGRRAIDYSKWVTKIYGGKLSVAEMDSLMNCLVKTEDYIATCPDSFHSDLRQLASCEESLFRSAIHPFIVNVCSSIKDSAGKKASPVAVIMELALSTDDNIEATNFLSVAKDLISDKNAAKNTAGAIIPSLALLSHSSVSVRSLAVDLLEVVSQFSQADVGPLHEFTKICSTRSAVLAGSDDFLSEIFATFIGRARNPVALHDSLLDAMLTFIAARGSIASNKSGEVFRSVWLQPGFAIGGYNAGAVILDALEAGGEKVCPIASRWKRVGKHIIMAMNSTVFGELDSVSVEMARLVRSVVKILKAVKSPGITSDHSLDAKTIITTGPASRGGRQRSYSFGKAEGVSFVIPYPKEMQESLVSVLSSNNHSALQKTLKDSVFEILLQSKSWKSEVFSGLPCPTKQAVASALLSDAADGTTQDADLVFFSLPLNAGDVSNMIDQLDNASLDLAKLSFLTDFARINIKTLIVDSSVCVIIDSIFKRLSILSQSSMQSESKEYARNAILDALYEFFNVASESQASDGILNSRKKHLSSWSKMLLDIIDADENSSLDPFTTVQAKRKAYTVIASISRVCPTETSSNLIHAIESGVSGFQSRHDESNSFSECIDIIVPVFLETAEASDLSVKDLMVSFLRSTNGAQREHRYVLYEHFMQALVGTKATSVNSSILASFVGATIACEIHLTAKEEDSKDSSLMRTIPDVATALLGYSGGPLKLEVIQILQAYAKDLLSAVAEDEDAQSEVDQLPLSSQDLLSVVLKGPQDDLEEALDPSLFDTATIDELIQTLMVVVCDCVTSTESRRVIKRSKQENVTTIFRIWQDLLLVQAIHNTFVDKELAPKHQQRPLIDGVGEIVLQTLDALQRALSTEHFLAFVTTLIRDGETDDLRSRAIQLIADRSEMSHGGPAEATLFLDMVPLLLELVDTLSNGSEGSKTLIQAGFVAIESIGRNCFISMDADDRVPKDAWASSYLAVVTKSQKYVDQELQTSQGSSFDDLPATSLQIIISAALCLSTSIRITGPMALPVLPQLMKALFYFLKVSSRSLSANPESSLLIMLQVSSLRFFSSVIQTLPMFIKPYILNILLCGSLVVGQSHAMKENDRMAVEGELRRLKRCIIASVPSRQLIPAASKPVSKSQNIQSTEWIISIVTESIRSSKSSELPSQVEGIVKVATTSFCGNHANDFERNKAIDLGIDLLLSLILKLSEVQLRALYSRLGDWCGSINRANPEESALRRLALWRLSSRLSMELKSIFLPCLSITFSEAATELELAASILCKKDPARRKSGGTKRQKLSEDETAASLDNASLQALRSLLLCLERSLRSDARDGGGSWIRSENQRFDLLLEPLTKLFLARLPLSDSKSSTLSYRSLVRGHEDEGSLVDASGEGGTVIDTLVALALATGDEQMWKPLNHAVLRACSNENRAEVRNAGAACLLALINSIGEEYMVLIPECLPVLSELLEDVDEETTGLAQECITQSEELLGETINF